MYIDSGGIPEYCQDYGVSFTNGTFVEKLKHVIDNYPAFVDQLKEYPFNSEKMCEDFYNLFNSLYEKNINFDKPKLNFILKEIVLISTVFLNRFTDLMNRLKIFTIINVIKR